MNSTRACRCDVNMVLSSQVAARGQRVQGGLVTTGRLPAEMEDSGQSAAASPIRFLSMIDRTCLVTSPGDGI